MPDTTPTGALTADEQKQQETLDQIEPARRLVSIAAIRAEIGDNPNLTDAQCAAIEAASDAAILEAIDGAAYAIEDRLYALHDEIQSDAIAAITSA